VTPAAIQIRVPVVRRMMVEKGHERTVRNKRHDPFRFIIRGFQTTNPRENDYQSQTQHAETYAIQSSGYPIERSDYACSLVLSSAG
jgi:hypothetical protein